MFIFGAWVGPGGKLACRWPKLQRWSTPEPAHDGGVRVVRAASCPVVFGEAMKALWVSLSPPREGLAVEARIRDQPVQILVGQHFMAVQAVVCNPVSSLVCVGGMENGGLISPISPGTAT